MNSSLIENFRVSYDETNVDLNRSFPLVFNVSFNEFGQSFFLVFARKREGAVSANQETSADQSEIYVIDDLTDEPIKYIQKDKYVIMNYFYYINFYFVILKSFLKEFMHFTETSGKGIATLIRNSNDHINLFRIVNLLVLKDKYS